MKSYTYKLEFLLDKDENHCAGDIYGYQFRKGVKDAVTQLEVQWAYSAL